MQKTQRRSRTSSWQFWWLDNSRPQSPKGQLRVSKQSSIRSRGAGSSYSRNPSVSVQKTKLRKKPTEACKSSWNPRGNQETLKLTIPWNSAKLVKIFSGIIARLHHIDRRLMVLPKEQCAEWRTAPLLYCCNRAEWKLVGRFHGMLHLSAKRYRSLVWWEDALWKTFRETIQRTNYSIWFHWLSIILKLRKISTESINLERKFYLYCSSDTLSTRVEFGKVTYWSKTLRSWRRWTHRKSTQKDSMRKRWYFPNKENLFFQSLMDESKHPEKIRNWEQPPWYGRVQVEERVTLIFLENQKCMFHHLTTHFQMPVKQ